MGLDTTHNAWHGAYSAFHRWRQKLAEVAGLPPLELMEGFYANDGNPCHDPFWRMPQDAPFRAGLPIKWGCLKPDALYELLYHSDCDGSIPPESCKSIADRLEELLPLLPEEDAGGHIGIWREKTFQFIKGLRKAAKTKTGLHFH